MALQIVEVSPTSLSKVAAGALAVARRLESPRSGQARRGLLACLMHADDRQMQHSSGVLRLGVLSTRNRASTGLEPRQDLLGEGQAATSSRAFTPQSHRLHLR